MAGLFYDDDPGRLGRTVDALLADATVAFPAPAAVPAAATVAGGPAAVAPEAATVTGGPAAVAGAPLAGILVPHAGLVYSGLVAAAAWRLVPGAAGSAGPTVVLLGTNHGAAWLTGVGTWSLGPWRTPLGDVEVDDELVRAVLALGRPFEADPECHLGEHSIEVQLPFVGRVAPGARIVPLSVGTGTGARAIEAGERLGALLSRRRAAGDPVVLAISTDMAHYPPAEVAERVTATLLPHVLGLDPAALATAEARVRRSEPRTSCGMCGIEPAVLGVAALRAMGAAEGVALATATSADAGGDPGRTVGYLAVAFPAG